MQTPSSQSPSHPDIVEVITQQGSFTSYAIAKRSFHPGTVIATLRTPTLTISDRAYSSVQIGPGPTDHVELNSDFLFTNHSCEPTLEFHIVKPTWSRSNGDVRMTTNDIVIDIRIAGRKDAQGNPIGLSAGEKLTFFYPSTEWDLDQSFECLCGSSRCLGTIKGASHLSDALIFGNDHYVNEHILYLKRQQRIQNAAKRVSSEQHPSVTL